MTFKKQYKEKRTPEIIEKEKEVKMQLLEIILKINALGFSFVQIATVAETSKQVINSLKVSGSECYIKLEKAEKMLAVLTEFHKNCKNPEYITLLKLRDLYKMPNATMEELMKESERRVDEEIKKHSKDV